MPEMPLSEIKPANTQAEADLGRVPLRLDPEDLAWPARHCGCPADASEGTGGRCGRIRFRASAALHPHGQSG
jgi:hypothetical protein